MTVYFDRSCPLCQAEIGYYRRKDQAGALCLADISKTGAVTPEGITRQRAMEPFAVRASDRRVLSGAAAFVEVWTRLPQLALGGARRVAAGSVGLPWSWATGCFFRSGRSSPASLDESSSFRRRATEPSAGDWAI